MAFDKEEMRIRFWTLKKAVDVGKEKIVPLRAKRDAHVNKTGWAPLHYAAFEGQPEVVKYLLEKGAVKNSLAPNGYTPLMLAARNGKVDAARVLLYEDPDLTIKGPKGETALSLAKEKDLKEMETLLRRAGAFD